MDILFNKNKNKKLLGQVIFDNDGYILYIDNKAQKLLEFSDFVGKSFFEKLIPESKKHLIQ